MRTRQRRGGRVWLRGEMAACRLLICCQCGVCLPAGPGASNFPIESSAIFPALSLWLIQHSAFACLLIGGYTPIPMGDEFMGWTVSIYGLCEAK